MNPASGMILKSTTDSCVQNWKKEGKNTFLKGSKLKFFLNSVWGGAFKVYAYFIFSTLVENVRNIIVNINYLNLL